MGAGPRPAGRLHVEVLAPSGARHAAAGLAAWLAAVAPRRARGGVTVALVSDRGMRTLNRRYRRVDAATDVLSFPAFAMATAGKPAASATVASPGDATEQRWFVRPASGPHAAQSAPILLGDIVIANGVARRQAAAAGHALRTELRVLALHGLLHLLGFDHERDDGVMARAEQRLRRRGALREGLIERETPRSRPRARA